MMPTAFSEDQLDGSIHCELEVTIIAKNPREKVGKGIHSPHTDVLET